jgi:hypothetical protein
MGPLVIAVSAWTIESALEILDGLCALEPEFRAAPWTKQSDFVPLGDSKKIYQPSKGLSGLAFAVQFFESIINHQQSSNQLWFSPENLAKQDIERVESRPWFARCHSFDRHESCDVLAESTLLFAKEKLAQLGVNLVDFRLRVLDELYFNESTARLGNKSDVLGQLSLNLAWQILNDTADQVPLDRIEIYCDRQGGRKKYAALLSHTFQEFHEHQQVPFIASDLETPEASSYSMRYREIPTSIRFQVQGDSLFPPAASSMVAKWMRESLMARLNRYWQGIVGEDLKPTAGYAVDAARFAKEIEPWVTKLSLEKNHWWRLR